jgi:hypothetical protein
VPPGPEEGGCPSSRRAHCEVSSSPCTPEKLPFLQLTPCCSGLDRWGWGIRPQHRYSRRESLLLPLSAAPEAPRTGWETF